MTNRGQGRVLVRIVKARLSGSAPAGNRTLGTLSVQDCEGSELQESDHVTKKAPCVRRLFSRSIEIIANLEIASPA